MKNTALAIAAVMAGLAWAGWQAGVRQQATLPSALEGRELEVSGYLCDVPSRGSFNSVRFGFCVDQWHLRDSDAIPSGRLPDRLRLAWYDESATINPGHRLQLTVFLKRPHGAVNPEGFRYESWLFRQGFGATGTVRELARDEGVYCPLHCRYHHWRAGLVEAAEQRLSGARHFPLISSLMIGHRGYMEPEHWTVLKATGTIHLVAISGLHLGLIAVGAGFLCRRLLLVFPDDRISPARLRGLVFLAVAFASLGYALAAGFSVPTRRALFMVVIAGWVVLGARQTGAFTGLLTALALVVFADPFSPLDQGFWLSFGAVSVLVLLFSARAGKTGWLGGLLLAQLAVFAGLWPILAGLGQGQPVVGLVANLFAIPWVSLVVMPLVVAAAVLLVFVPAADPLVIAVLDAAFEVLWHALTRLAEVDVGIRPPDMLAVVLVSALVLVALLVPFAFFRRVTVGVIAVWLTLESFQASDDNRNTPVAHPEIRVWDVGQGLSVMVRSQGQVLVYDTGPGLEGVYSSVESVLIPNLNALGVRRIDTLVISHGDGDHAGGLPLLLEHFSVGRVISGEPDRVAELIGADANVQVEPCSRQINSGLGKLELNFWRRGDLENAEGEGGDSNDASCVLTVSSADPAVTLVLPGDITRSTEQAFIRQAGNRRWQADHYRVVLAPHHGSKTSSSEAWIGQMAPDLTIVSAGYRHHFGHPHPDVVGRYLTAGSELHNTAMTGALRLVLEPEGLVTTMARAQAPFWIRRPESY